MGYRARPRVALPAMFALAVLFGACACRAAERRALSASGSAAPQGFHRRTGYLASRHASRGLRSRQFVSGSRDATVGGRSAETDGLSNTFLHGAIEVSHRLGCNPRDLLAVMMRESHINAHAQNRFSSATGLIQFLPSTLTHLGWPGSAESFRELSAEEQLPWVEKFLMPSSHYGLGTAARVYQAVFMPASLRLGASADTALIDRRGICADRYQRNRPLDIDGDGRITVRELQQAIDRCCQSPAWQEVERRFQLVEAGGEVAAAPAEVTNRSPHLPGSVPSVPSVEPVTTTRRGDRLLPTSQPWTNITAPAATIENGDLAAVRTGAAGTSPRAAGYPAQPGAALNLRNSAGLSAALNALGYDADPYTVSTALRTFQRREGLNADGGPGQKTLTAIALKLTAAGLPTTL